MEAGSDGDGDGDYVEYKARTLRLNEVPSRKRGQEHYDENYFRMYGRIELHEWLLKDSVRNRAYREAILHNQCNFKDKTVLDVGCGTGILSLFAAKAGAAHVIAVDAANIVEYARRVFKDNGYKNLISVVKGKIEDIELPQGVEKVDIIVCDWMGNCLFAEGMLESLLFARDKWLKPNGLIFPDTAQLYLTAITQNMHSDRDLTYWNNVYGFDMSCIRRCFESKAVVDAIDAQQLMSEVFLIKSIDLYTARYQQTANFRSFYELKMTRSGPVHALLAYFDVGFSKTPDRVSFSTSPRKPWTHWNQTVFYFKDLLPVRAGEFIKGVFGLKPSSHNKRDLEFDIYIDFEGKEKCITSNQSYILCHAPAVEDV
ncbi:protein arginine N-methyltransferase 1-B [Drosophila tropicalis]|uniref:protein arginine N-methyltransferase 1-B n=1 Tax=Drosophila tropicalis TaxID=46794 RepID=UPI0035AB7782